MNPAGHEFSGVVLLSKKRFLLPLFLAILCALVTGCPHNDYTVELKPKSNGVERILVFYRSDGSNSNGAPNYQTFPSNQLAAITRTYPAGAVRRDGQRYIARGKFTGRLPKDVGGVGSYTNLVTSLGDAGFYLERFRGNDNLVASTEKRFQAADQITDLVIGWTRTQFGRDRGYGKLHKFLDHNLRRDLKNAGLYFWLEQVSALSNTNAAEEYAVRFGQYLLERGYLKLSNLPELYLAVEDSDGSAILNLTRQLLAQKMGIAESGPLPKSFSVLSNPAAFEKSWTNYLVRTRFYRAKLKAWEKKKKTNPKLQAPKPMDVVGDLAQNLLEPLNVLGGAPDHLTVKLALKRRPNYTNGKWHDGQVVWTDDLEENRPLPVLCYASWSDPNADFQKAHFGKVILDGGDLSEYCLWQGGLGAEQQREWETFLAGLEPGNNLRQKLKAFQFGVKPAQTNQLAVGRKLLMDALPEMAGTNSAGSK